VSVAALDEAPLPVRWAVLTAVLAAAVAGCGRGASAPSATRYDAQVSKLCLSLISRLAYVDSHTTFARLVPPRGSHDQRGLLANQTRDRFVRAGRQRAAVVDSVLAELRALPVSAAQRPAKLAFASELAHGAAAYRSFVASVKQSRGTRKLRTYLRGYAAGYVAALKGCRGRISG
jgi:hypothetical protein